ncbi:peptidoglycan-binding protein [Luteococcus sp. H138]|uniref:L,D-transpeptidase family protein n=1 Tax=unclassified Luteococcus TaxID=2639923 RepID=UPI00313CE0DC
MPSHTARIALALSGACLLAGCSQTEQSAHPAPEASEGSTQDPSVAPTSAAPASASPSAPASATPSAVAVLKAGATGDRVRELQHRLQQLEWFEGKITGTFGDATSASVRGFQEKRQLPVNGVVDATTWNELVKRTKQPTRDQLYNIMKPGPALLKQGMTGAKVRELQARLKQIGWFSGKVSDNYGPATGKAVKDFQTKRGIPVTGEVDQRTLDRLAGMTRQPTREELNNLPPKVVAPRLDPRCLTGRALCISKSADKLAWVVDGKVQSVMSVRFGSELTPTREGTFQVNFKSRDHVSTLYHTRMPFAMFFSGGQAVHYSSDFAARGYNGASHGCVNVRNYDGIAALFDQVRTGDKVIVYR